MTASWIAISLRETWPEAAYESIQGTLWLFRQRWTERAEEEQSRLARVFLYSPDLPKAYARRECLTLIFDHATSKTHAIQALQAWREQVQKSGLRGFDRFLTTLDNWTNERSLTTSMIAKPAALWRA